MLSHFWAGDSGAAARRAAVGRGTSLAQRGRVARRVQCVVHAECCEHFPVNLHRWDSGHDGALTAGFTTDPINTWIGYSDFTVYQR